MKNSGFKPRSKPMKSGSLNQNSTLVRSTFKKHAPKKRAGHDKSMLKACHGQRCYLCVAGICCSYEGDPTVVPCHSNQSKHGKGGAIKARDEFTVPGCYQCHAWLDQGSAPREEKDAIWNAAYEQWKIDRDNQKIL